MDKTFQIRSCVGVARAFLHTSKRGLFSYVLGSKFANFQQKISFKHHDIQTLNKNIKICSYYNQGPTKFTLMYLFRFAWFLNDAKYQKPIKDEPTFCLLKKRTSLWKTCQQHSNDPSQWHFVRVELFQLNNSKSNLAFQAFKNCGFDYIYIFSL